MQQGMSSSVYRLPGYACEGGGGGEGGAAGMQLMPRAGTDHGSIAAEACWQHQVVPDEWPQLRLRLLLCGVQTSVMAPGIQTSHSRRPWSGPICVCIYDLHGVLLPPHANLCFTFLAKQLRAFLHMLPYCSSCCLSCFCCSSCSRLLFRQTSRW
jgi:hypothetical protein